VVGRVACRASVLSGHVSYLVSGEDSGIHSASLDNRARPYNAQNGRLSKNESEDASRKMCRVLDA
jgi:hypothetical protein